MSSEKATQTDNNNNDINDLHDQLHQLQIVERPRLEKVRQESRTAITLMTFSHESTGATIKNEAKEDKIRKELVDKQNVLRTKAQDFARAEADVIALRRQLKKETSSRE